MRRAARANRRYVTVLVLVISLTFGVVALTRAPWFAPPAHAGVSDAPAFSGRAEVAELRDTRTLALVNADHGLGAKKTSGLTKAWPTVPVRATDIELNKTVLGALKEMFAAADDAGAGSLYVTSGYRSRVHQKKIYNQAKDKSYVQRPGFSEHETGLAVDILAKKIGQDAFAASNQAHWLAGHAWEYGFVLRYPDGKKDVTGISYESWHFRYVGKPHAWYCDRNGLAFEEYLDALKSGLRYSVKLGGTEYVVAYEKPRGGKIGVPEDQKYAVSGDNAGGYIVTAWR